MTVMQRIAAAAAISIMTVNAAQHNTHLYKLDFDEKFWNYLFYRSERLNADEI